MGEDIFLDWVREQKIAPNDYDKSTDFHSVDESLSTR
jgi:hypothetical protein